MMNGEIINRTISAMCIEISSYGQEPQDWQKLSEDDIWYEIAVCIFGSQMQFELAVATADRLKDFGLLKANYSSSRPSYEMEILDSLSQPLLVLGKNGEMRLVKPRFKNRLASLLATTVAQVCSTGRSLRDLLSEAEDAKEARKILMMNVWGFGPKQASLFLRRIGYCSELAVLDVHVLDYLYLVRGIRITPNRLGRLSFYEEIEDMFREISSGFGYSLGCVDLATWLTMRVAKKEAYL
jgi:N-glycosylase/DNA lyase